ncbi:hypothetical protein BJ912DRAFT_111544 [Pholiota molesta]|nr:hypothetical protein BJ912DRAFT_111544 [Pholiota molesta]
MQLFLKDTVIVGGNLPGCTRRLIRELERIAFQATHCGGTGSTGIQPNRYSIKKRDKRKKNSDKLPILPMNRGKRKHSLCEAESPRTQQRQLRAKMQMDAGGTNARQDGGDVTADPCTEGRAEAAAGASMSRHTQQPLAPGSGGGRMALAQRQPLSTTNGDGTRRSRSNNDSPQGRNHPKQMRSGSAVGASQITSTLDGRVESHGVSTPSPMYVRYDPPFDGSLTIVLGICSRMAILKMRRYSELSPVKHFSVSLNVYDSLFHPYGERHYREPSNLERLQENGDTRRGSAM